MSLSELRAEMEGSSPPSDSTPNYYCLEPGHAPQLVSKDRFFYFDPDEPGAPICPVCSVNAGKSVRVSATPAPENGDYPDGFRDLAARVNQEVED